MATIKQTLIDLFKLNEMPAEKAGETADKLAKLVIQAVLIRVLPKLSEKDFDEYEKIVESNQGPEILFDFFNKKVPGFDNMVLEEAENLRAEFVGDLEALKS